MKWFLTIPRKLIHNFVPMMHTCQFCAYSSSSSTGLERHVRTHTGERPFGCRYCFVRMALKSNLDRHEKMHRRKMVKALMDFATQVRAQIPKVPPPLYLWKNGPSAL